MSQPLHLDLARHPVDPVDPVDLANVIIRHKSGSSNSHHNAVPLHRPSAPSHCAIPFSPLPSRHGQPHRSRLLFSCALPRHQNPHCQPFYALPRRVAITQDASPRARRTPNCDD
jgi:hypothetical protein